jgi:hypothetical protein
MFGQGGRTRAAGLGAIVALTALVVAMAAGTSRAAPEDVAVGDLRVTFQATPGTPLRAEPRTLAKGAAVLPAGTRVRIDEVRGAWVRVTVGDAQRSTGWILARQTVDPAARSMGRETAATVQGAGAGPGGTRAGFTSQEVAAAARQFGPATEEAYRGTRAVYEFIEAGRLGHPRTR